MSESSYHIAVRFHVDTTLEVKFSHYTDTIDEKKNTFNRKDARRVLRALIDQGALSAEPFLKKEATEEEGGQRYLAGWIDVKVVDHQPVNTHVEQ
tara:strand:- start:408 stop:692 length:285 start_codon:yes stop_codon:yes gene_type:complete